MVRVRVRVRFRVNVRTILMTLIKTALIPRSRESRVSHLVRYVLAKFSIM